MPKIRQVFDLPQADVREKKILLDWKRPRLFSEYFNCFTRLGEIEVHYSIFERPCCIHKRYRSILGKFVLVWGWWRAPNAAWKSQYDSFLLALSIYFWHAILPGTLQVVTKTTDATHGVKPPANLLEHCCFRGMCNVYQPIVSSLSRIAVPLFAKLKNGSSICSERGENEVVVMEQLENKWRHCRLAPKTSKTIHR